MTIRKTVLTDLPAVMQIFTEARAFMREAGNLKQWPEGWPSQEQIVKDIEAKGSYVCLNEAGEIAAVFYFNVEEDPGYAKIDGSWLNDEPYGVVHRIARSQSVSNTKGAGAFCLEWCFSRHPNIRIDTHKDNAPMLVLLERLGFKKCGVIQLWPGADGERVAFQKILEK